MKRVPFYTHCLVILLLALVPAAITHAAPADPYLVQPQVQSDLENLLSRMIPSEQFLVQISTDVALRQDRQVVEGEVFTTTTEKETEPVPMMPGFLPEVREKPDREPQRTRQVYRMVEKPVLKLVRASITFDDELEAPVVSRARILVQNYLRTAYPNQAVVAFTSLPMLKPKKEIPLTDNPLEKKAPVDTAEEPKEKTESEPSVWEQYGPYGLGALLLLMVWMWISQSRARQISESQSRAERRALGAGANPASPWGMDGRSGFPNPMQFFRGLGTTPPLAPPVEQAPEKIRDLRKTMLQRFLSRSSAFKRYYGQLSPEEQEELYACLAGPAYDNLLGGLNIRAPKGEIPEPPEKDKVLEQHSKNFDEFTQAKDWQDKQFFGYLQDITDEQLLALVNHCTPLAACLMLRFMTPHQSALVLDALPSARRREILEQANQMNAVSFAEIYTIEREVRENVHRMPQHLFGSRKEDIEFWGSVLTEAENQDGILKDIEQTNPGIYPSLKKYKFKLEDAASLPNPMLEKILAQSDNEELSLALATCPHELIEVFFDAISAKRREVIEYQIASSKNASNDEKTDARIRLTKRFREVMA
jgi:hypothetical protein